MSKLPVVVILWASAVLFPVSKSYSISLCNVEVGNPLRNGEALYGGSAMLAGSPPFSMKKSIKKAFKIMGRVASFHTGEDMLPLEEFVKTGDVRHIEVPNTLRSKQLPASIKKILKVASKVASFHPGEDFQVIKQCKIQAKYT
jgi:hypothetical protein